MALKKSGVRVSLAPLFFRFIFLLVFPIFLFLPERCPAQQPNSQLPDAVLYALANSQGGVTLSVAYRDKVSSTQVQTEVLALIRSLKLNPLGRLDIKTEASMPGVNSSTSAYVKLRGVLPSNAGIPVLLPYLEAFHGRKRILIIMPADIRYGNDRTDWVANSEAYRIQWARAQDGAFQYEVVFRDPEAALTEPIFHPTVTPNTGIEDETSGRTSTSTPLFSKMLSILLALAGGILLIGVVLVIIRHRRVTT